MNKIVLLTIFLYITLNLRKVEKFIDGGFNYEGFTAPDRIVKLGLDVRMQIAMVKLMLLAIGILIVSDKVTKPNGDSGFIPSGQMEIMMIIVAILMTALLAILYYTETLDLQSITWIESLLNESISMVLIYVVIKSAIGPAQPIADVGERILCRLQENNWDSKTRKCEVKPTPGGPTGTQGDAPGGPTGTQGDAPGGPKKTSLEDPVPAATLVKPDFNPAAKSEVQPAANSEVQPAA